MIRGTTTLRPTHSSSASSSATPRNTIEDKEWINIAQKFRMFDADKDGYLTKYELKNLLLEYFKHKEGVSRNVIEESISKEADSIDLSRTANLIASLNTTSAQQPQQSKVQRMSMHFSNSTSDIPTPSSTTTPIASKPNHQQAIPVKSSSAPALPSFPPVTTTTTSQDAQTITNNLQTLHISSSSATSDSSHYISNEEKRAFVDYINTNMKLREDKDLVGKLPIDPNSNQIFQLVSDGVLFCKMLDSIKPGVIPAHAIKLHPKNKFEQSENHTLAINAAKQLGCSVVNIGPEDLVQGKPHLVLGILWQIIKLDVLSKVSIQNHPEICRLVSTGGADAMSLKQIASVSPEEVLLRWVNHHLKKAGYHKPVTNFSNDIKDGIAYSVLMNQIAPSQYTQAALCEPDPMRRAQLVCHAAKQIDALKFIGPEDILTGNSKLNLAFIGNLFNQHPAIDLPSLEELERLKAQNASLSKILDEAEARLRQIMADRQLAHELQQQEILLYRQRKLEEQRQLERQEAYLLSQTNIEELRRIEEEAKKRHQQQLQQKRQQELQQQKIQQQQQQKLQRQQEQERQQKLQQLKLQQEQQLKLQQQQQQFLQQQQQQQDYLQQQQYYLQQQQQQQQQYMPQQQQYFQQEFYPQQQQQQLYPQQHHQQMATENYYALPPPPQSHRSYNNMRK